MGSFEYVTYVLFNYVLEQAPNVVSVMDRRLRAIPQVRDAARRGMGYRTFRTGLTGWGKWTATDHVALMQQLSAVVSSDDGVMRTDSATRKAYVKAVDNATLIYLTCNQREITELDLNMMHAAVKELGPLLTKAMSGLPESIRKNINRPKLHGLLHFRYTFLCALTYVF